MKIVTTTKQAREELIEKYLRYIAASVRATGFSEEEIVKNTMRQVKKLAKELCILDSEEV